MSSESSNLVDERLLRAVLAEAEAEVRHRLRRQPFPKPQFIRGVESGLRWFEEALGARLDKLFGETPEVLS